MDSKAITGGESFLRLLAGMGVDRIFASPGSEWAPVWEYLAKPYGSAGGVPGYFSSRHEEIAVGMASGYAKASGKLPAVMIHTTVGGLHAAMALRGALHENVPMVVFAGESIGFGEEEGPDPGAQWLRSLADVGGPARLVEHCVKWSFGVNAKSVFPSTIQRACQLAMAAPRGPVFVSLPMEFLFDRMSISAPAAAAIPLRATADPRGIEQLADMLAGARQPVIVTERCGQSVAAASHLVELAQLLGAPVVETRAAVCVNFPRDHPLHAGFDPLPVVRDADVVFMPGAVAPWHPASAAPGAGTTVAVLDENPLRIEKPVWGYQVDLCLCGEMESSLALLLERLKARVPAGDAARARSVESWSARNQARRRAWVEDARAGNNRKPLDTRWVVHELNRALPANAAIVEETITHREGIIRGLERLAPGGFFAGCIGGLGTGIGTALGVKAAAPERPVIALIGDGTFHYNPVPAGLGFAQEYAMPILIVLFNNQGYLSQQSELPRYYPQGFAVKAGKFAGTSIRPSPDYAALARAFGGHGEKVEEPGEVRAAIERGLQAIGSGKLALLDMRLDPVP